MATNRHVHPSPRNLPPMRSVRSVGRAAVLLLMLLLAAARPAVADEPPLFAPNQGRVLVINSYTRATPYTRAQELGIESVLHAGKPTDHALIYEDLNVRPETTEQAFDVIAASMRLRYRDVQIRLIMTTDSTALRFASKYAPSVFPGVPVVFCAATEPPTEAERQRLDCTGVVEQIDVAGTLALISELHPRVRRVVAVCSSTSEFGRRMGDLTRRAAESIEPPRKLNVELADPGSREELTATIAGLADDSAVLYLSFVDSQGRGWSAYTGLPALAESTSAPIYGLYDTLIGHGIVGGRVVSGRAMGAAAGRLALRVLAGEQASSIPLDFTSCAAVMFDDRQLRRHGVSRSMLPAGSIVQFEPPPLSSRYRAALFWGGAALAVQSIAVGVLLYGRSVRRRAQRRLAADRERLHTAVTGSQMGIWEWDIADDTTRWTGRVDQFFGEEMEEHRRSQLLRERLHPEDRERVMARIRAHLDHGEPYDIEYRLMTDQGEYRWQRSRGIAVRDSAGRPVRMLGTLADIHDRVMATKLLREQNRLLEMIAGVEPLERVLEEVVLSVQRQEPEVIGSVLLLEPDGRTIRCVAAPDLPPEFTRTVDGATIGPLRGSCGTAMHERRRVIVPDIETDPLWSDFGQVALAHGLRACWSEPIFGSDGAVLGSLAVYYRSVRTPSQREIDLIATAARLAGIAAERRRAESALRDSEERYRRLVEGVRMIAWEVDLANFRFTFVSGPAEEILGFPITDWYGESFWQDHIHPEDRDRAMRFCQEQTALGQGHQFEYRMLAADGRTVWIQDVVSIVRSDGRVTGLRGIMVDTTARKQAEAELEQFFSLAPGMLCTAGIDGYFKRVNPAFVRALGHTEEHLLSRPFIEFVHPDDRAATIAEADRLNSGGPPGPFENRYLHADGSYRWISWRSTHLTENGVLYAAARDVTEERAAAEALRRSEATKSALLDALPDVMFYMDREGRYLDYSAPPGVELLVPPERFVGRKATDVLPPDRARQCMAAVEAVIRTGEPRTYEYTAGEGAGARHWEVRVVRVGAGDEVLLLVRNVTAQRAAQQALRESQRRLSILVKQAPIGVIVLNTRFEIVEWNPSAERIFGFSAQDAVGRHASIIVPAESRSKTAEVWQALMEQRGGAHTITENITRSGERIMCEWNNTPLIGAAGVVIGVSSFVQDVTERVLSERRQSLMMQELDHRVKNNMAAVVSLAEQTGRACATLDEFQATFTGRVRALARIHTVLAANRWRGAELQALIRQIVEPYSGPGPERLELDGPSVLLPPRCAQSLAMTFNELATNAAKYGALSVVEGRIIVRWRLSSGAPGEASTLAVHWAERGGPPVSPPTRRGLGIDLIEGAVAFQLGGSVKFSYQTAGLECHVSTRLGAEEHVDGAGQPLAAEIR